MIAPTACRPHQRFLGDASHSAVSGTTVVLIIKQLNAKKQPYNIAEVNTGSIYGVDKTNMFNPVRSVHVHGNLFDVA